MARYIDLDKCGQYRTNHGGYPDTFAFPPWAEFEDVSPVIHAHWKWKLADNGWADTTCSNCGHVWNMDVHVSLDYDYCPYCGAKMDEVTK